MSPGQNATVTSLRAFFGRRIPIWEGHVRDGLASLVSLAAANKGNPTELAKGMVAFMGGVASGFSPTAFGNRFVTEAQNGCAATAPENRCTCNLWLGISSMPLTIEGLPTH
ncbi:MAG: hypothetical protein IPN84_17570 [Sphingomonadales bacterium]|nr:hypothetical protein [Sphingomonadales bacterium]